LMWVGGRVSQPIPRSWQHVQAWGGLRGAISLALVLSLPVALGGDRDLLKVMAFGVVLFTLLGQATTMRPLVRWLRIVTRTESQTEYELRHARLASLRAAENHVNRMHNDGLLSTPTWERLQPYISGRARALSDAVREVLRAAPALEAEELDTGWRELLRAQKGALLGLRRDGVISEDSFEQLTAEIDTQLDEATIDLEAATASPTQFVEITLAADSLAADKTVAELGLPRAAVLVSIQRGESLIIPRGDTHMHPGDVVTFLAEREHIARVRQLLGSPERAGEPELNTSETSVNQ
jgi:NhaP-type Na+/H+ and K+/H+ antiporter